MMRKDDREMTALQLIGTMTAMVALTLATVAAGFAILFEVLA